MIRLMLAAVLAATTLSGCAAYNRMMYRPVDWSGEVRGDWKQVADCASQRLGPLLQHTLTAQASTGTAVIKSGMYEEFSLRQVGDNVRVEHRSPFAAATKENSIVWAAITGCSQPVRAG